MGVNCDFGGDPGFGDEAIAGGTVGIDVAGFGGATGSATGSVDCDATKSVVGCDTGLCGVDRPEGDDNAGDEVGDAAGDVGLTVSLRD